MNLLLQRKRAVLAVAAHREQTFRIEPQHFIHTARPLPGAQGQAQKIEGNAFRRVGQVFEPRHALLRRVAGVSANLTHVVARDCRRFDANVGGWLFDGLIALAFWAAIFATLALDQALGGSP